MVLGGLLFAPAARVLLFNIPCPQTDGPEPSACKRRRMPVRTANGEYEWLSLEPENDERHEKDLNVLKQVKRTAMNMYVTRSYTGAYAQPSPVPHSRRPLGRQTDAETTRALCDGTLQSAAAHPRAARGARVGAWRAAAHWAERDKLLDGAHADRLRLSRCGRSEHARARRW